MAQGQSKKMKVLIILACGVMANPVAALDLANCYARSYSADHLASHPIQQVSAIWMTRATEEVAPPGMVLNLSVRLKTSREVFLGTAYCAPEGSGLACGMEGDAGTFVIAPRKDAVLIALDRAGISFEGQSDFVTLSGSTGDDREFLLPVCP